MYIRLFYHLRVHNGVFFRISVISYPTSPLDDFEVKNLETDGESPEGMFKEAMLKECKMFLVDCHANMLQKNNEGQSLLFNVIELLAISTRKLIISSPTDLVSVAFYGSKKHANESSFPGLYILYPPAGISIPRTPMFSRHSCHAKASSVKSSPVYTNRVSYAYIITCTSVWILLPQSRVRQW